MFNKVAYRILAGISLLTIVCFFLWNSIEKLMIEKYLENSARRLFDAHLEYDRFHKEDGHLIFENIRLKQQEQEWLSAQSLRLRYSIKPLQANLHFDIALVHPILSIGETVIHSYSSPNGFNHLSLPKMSGLFHVSGTISVDDGKVKFLSLPEDSLTFQLKGDWTSISPHFYLRTWKKSNVGTINQVSLIFSGDLAHHLIEADIKAFDCALASRILAVIWPSLRNWKATEGTLSGRLIERWTSKHSKAIIGDIKLNDMKWKNPFLNLEGTVPSAQLILHENGGEIKFTKPFICCYIGQTWPYKTETHLVGNLLFLPHQPAMFLLEGSYFAQEHTFPIDLRGSLYLTAADNQSSIAFLELDTIYGDIPTKISIKTFKQSEGLQIQGSVTSLSNHLNFGCNIDLCSVWPYIPQGRWIPWLLGANEICLKDGWFKGQQLSLSQYEHWLAPGDCHIKGLIDLEGLFDLNSIVVYYDLHQFELHHPDFSFFLPSLPTTTLGDLSAVHYMDLISKNNGGIIPIQNGRFFHNESQKEITDLSGQLLIGENGLELYNGEAYVNGIFCSGDLVVEQFNHHVYDIALDLKIMNGTLNQVKEFLTQPLNQEQNPLLKIPLEAEFTLRQEGAQIHWHISPSSSTHRTIRAKAALFNGSLPKYHPLLSLQEVSCNIEYDEEKRSLFIEDLQGALLLGSPQHAEEFVLAGDLIEWSYYPNNSLKFDFWIGNKNRDFVRLVGQTAPMENNAAFTEFFLDRSLSHCGHIYPELFQLTIKDWSSIVKAKFHCKLQLGMFLRDLQDFSETNLFEFPSFFPNADKTSGDFAINLDYDDSTALFSYKIVGNDLLIDKWKFSSFNLEGKNRNRIWMIDEFRLDDLSISADLTHLEEDWKINFLGLQFRDLLLIGLEGRYLPTGQFKANVKLLEAKLEGLEQWPKLQQLGLKGNFKAEGNLLISQNQELGKWIWETALIGSLKNWSIKEILCSDVDKFHLNIHSNEKMTIEQLTTDIFNLERQPLCRLELAEMTHHFHKHETAVSELKFDLLKENGIPLLTLLKSHLSSEMLLCLSSIASQVHDNKHPFDLTNWNFDLAKSSNGEESQTVSSDLSPRITKLLAPSLKGVLNLTVNPHSKLLNIEFQEQKERLKSPYAMQKLMIAQDPSELYVKTECTYKQQPWILEMRKIYFPIESGSFLFRNSLTEPLAIYWHRDPEQGYIIQKISGSCPGINVNLLSSSSQELEGEIAIHLPQASELLTDSFSQAIEKAQLTGEYILNGQWKLEGEKTRFIGKIKGAKGSIFGLGIDSLTSTVEASPDVIKSSDLFIELCDGGGSLSTELALLQLDQGYWNFQCPHILGSRISLNKLQMSESSLMIRKIEVKNLTGSMRDLKKIKGYGEAFCIRPQQSEKQAPFWSISSDIISKLELNTTLLSPVSGTILFSLEEGKIILHKLKDAYSAGKLSKFYFPKSPKVPYFIDFDGNISLKIRMKQYNLFMKLSESFVLSIDGSLHNPIYQLTKYTADDEED